MFQMPVEAVGVNIVTTTMIFDRETLTGSNNEQLAPWSRAAEWKSLPTGLCGVTSPMLTARFEHADSACDVVKRFVICWVVCMLEGCADRFLRQDE